MNYIADGIDTVVVAIGLGIAAWGIRSLKREKNPYTVVDTVVEGAVRIYPSNCCPHCKSTNLVPGPSGGAGRNVLCRSCTHEHLALEYNFDGNYMFMEDYGPVSAERWTQVYRQQKPLRQPMP
jgi:hypothetical protein